MSIKYHVSSIMYINRNLSALQVVIRNTLYIIRYTCAVIANKGRIYV